MSEKPFFRLTIMLRLLIVAIVLMTITGSADAQQVTCAAALKSTPPGPFPCVATLTWTDNSGKANDQEQRFIMERRVNGGVWTLFNTTASNITTMLDSTLDQSAVTDNVYDYRVMAQNTGLDGKTLQNSGYSNVATITIPKVIPPINPPATPSGLTITLYNPDGSVAQVIQLSGNLTGKAVQ
jgi:hypothetical protein